MQVRVKLWLQGRLNRVQAALRSPRSTRSTVTGAVLVRALSQLVTQRGRAAARQQAPHLDARIVSSKGQLALSESMAVFSLLVLHG